MKSRPILFSGPMVRAILSGSKTMTRRIVKPQPPCDCAYVINGNHSHALCYHVPSAPDGKWTANTIVVPPTSTSTDHRLPCPYGEPGDRLIVRETFRFYGRERASGWEGGIEWRADLAAAPLAYFPRDAVDAFERSVTGGTVNKWRPSIHMPRWASRITLEVTDVRVERVQDISEADAKAEGASFHDGHGVGHSGWRHDFGDVYGDARSSFAALWDSINAARGFGWDSNPPVWAVSFRRVEE